MRGQLGTTAASHSNSAPITISDPPGLVKNMNVAYAITTVVAEIGGFAAYGGTGSVGQGNTLRSSGTITYGSAVREPIPGAGIPALAAELYAAYGRQARSRVV